MSAGGKKLVMAYFIIVIS